MSSGKLLGWTWTIFTMLVISYIVLGPEKNIYVQVLAVLQITILTVFGVVFGGRAIKKKYECKK